MLRLFVGTLFLTLPFCMWLGLFTYLFGVNFLLLSFIVCVILVLSKIFKLMAIAILE